MMNSKLKLCLLAVLPISQFAAAETVNSDINEALYYYCQQGSKEYEERVMVGRGQQVMYHQGAFLQISTDKGNQQQLDSVRQSLQQVGIEANCAQYLLSHATLAPNEQWQPQLKAQVLFDFDKSDLNAQSRYLLSQVKARIDGNESELTVVGNTDSLGSEQYNLVLGLKRSKSVTNYLNTNIKAITDGEQHPITSNDSEYGRHLNRRVEIELKPQS